MNLAAAFLAPFSMLLTAAGLGDGEGEEPAPAPAPANVTPDGLDETWVLRAWTSAAVLSPEPAAARQVHIEQRMTIRVAPRAAVPPPRDMLTAQPQRRGGPRLSERKIGKCIATAGIVGVEPSGPSSLILFMRDRRMISAELDRSCRSRAFYSGFYLSRSVDGKVCVDRDTLLSRSGSACKLSRIRQLVEEDD